jgi:hypothetical protein
MSIRKPISLNNNFYWFCLSILIVNIILIRLPLTGTFGYEFAAINGLFLTVVSGLFTLVNLSKPEFGFKSLLLSLGLFVLTPLVVIIIKSLLTMFCSFLDGMIFYILIVFTSVLFGTSLAFLIDIYLIRFKKIFFLLIVLLIAFIPVLEIYFLPQVYFYSPLIGFFPGNIYDEGLSPDSKLLLHQLIVSVFSILTIYLIEHYRQIILKSKYYFIIPILVVTVSFQLSSSALGFTTTFSKLENNLPKKIETERFCLHYDKMSELEAERAALNVEYYYRVLVKALNVNPSRQIQIYLYNDRIQKKILFGAGNADVAKPWQSAVYISVDSWEQTLKHELVHVFSAEFGTGIFKVASGFNPALIEGLAVSIEGTTDEISLNDFTALAFNHNHRVNVSSLFTGFNFFKANSSLGYTYSGAYILFLIEKYGIKKVKKFYSSGDFKTVFNNNIKSDENEFEKKLEANSTFGNQAMADYYFGRLSIIQKVCPRYISDRLSEAFDYLNNHKFDDAENLFKEINSKSLNYSALLGLSEIYLKQDNTQKAIQIIKNSISHFIHTPYYFNLSFRLGDLYARNQQNDSSAYYFAGLVTENPNHQLIYLSSTRLSLLEENKLAEYLGGKDSLRLKILIELNRSQYYYNSFPIIVDLLKYQNADYKSSLGIFSKTFVVDNFESSYAAFKISQYMLANGDYVNGRKYAALSLRFKNKNPFYISMKENFEKANWLFTNASDFLESFKINKDKNHSEVD